MSLGNRGLFVLLGVVSAVTFGCGGGGGGGGGGGRPATAEPTKAATPSPTPTSTTVSVTPTPVGPTQVPTALPTGSAIPVGSRPLSAGDTFSYSGTSLEAFLYYGATPNPSGTIATVVTQHVIDEGTASFYGANPYDFLTTETDAQQSPSKTITITTNTYYNTGPYTGSQTGFYTYGYSSSDSTGQIITDVIGSVGYNGGVPNGLVDILPEKAQQTWTNTEAQTLDESESDGFTSGRAYNANGTYVEHDSYPQGSQFTPQPTPLAATIAENADGSGTYNVPLLGPPNTTLTYSAPSNGIITIVASVPDGSGGTSTQQFTVNTWYALPLYTEQDREDGALTLPAACNVPAQFGTEGNGVEQKFTRVDTVIGTIDYFDQITYVVGGYAVCVSMSDVTYLFYDYTGQGNEPPVGVSFSGGDTPLETITFTSTLGLQSTSVSGAYRLDAEHPEVAAQRLAFARTSFLAAVERRRFERQHRLFQHIRSLQSERSHR